MVVPERDAPGKTAATIWPSPTATAMVQVTSSLSVLPRSQASTATKPMPPISSAQATGASCSGSLKPFFSRMKPRAARHHEGEHQLRRVVLGRLLAPAKDELVEALVEERDHRQHRARLNHDVEEVALVHVQPMFGDEQVAGGGNRQELGDSFHNSKQNYNNPVWHRGLDEKSGKRQAANETGSRKRGKYGAAVE